MAASEGSDEDLEISESEDEDRHADKANIVEDNGKFIRLDRVLKAGGISTAYIGTDTASSTEVTWTIVECSGITGFERADLAGQLQRLQGICHSNLVRIVDAWAHPDQTTFSVISEKVGATLPSYIRRRAKLESGPQNKLAMRRQIQHMLEGLQYLHESSPAVIHGNLTCDELFITKECNLLIGGLEVSVPLQGSGAQSLGGVEGFKAPEIYTGKGGTSVDIWALGMCVLQILLLIHTPKSRPNPYAECTNPFDIMEKVQNGEKPAVFSHIQDAGLQLLVGRCLESEPLKRAAASALLADPWLLENSDAAELCKLASS